MTTETPSTPVVIDEPTVARDWVKRENRAGRRVALVPTMGALHEGHLALVRRGREVADSVVVSIFVNPTQFGPDEDLDRYPRTMDEDLRLLRREGAAAVFAPTASQMYRAGASATVSPPRVAEPLEGICRPDHFRGVCTVVLKLFQILPASVAIFGQKDYQQARVIADMIADFDLDISLDLLPTVRDPDGLALSSRNRYLAPADRQRALSLARALDAAESWTRRHGLDPTAIETEMRRVLGDGGVDAIDYATVVDPLTLLPLVPPAGQLGDSPRSAGGEQSAEPANAVALIAAHVAGTRLIDNRRLP